MAILKPKKKSTSASINNDAEPLQSEVANFASSLGLFSPLPSSGFDDPNFHKCNKNEDKKNIEKLQHNKKNNNENFKNSNKKRKDEQSLPKPKAQAHFSVDNLKMFDKFKNIPKLSLIKATSLGVWYADAAELEEKLIGSDVDRKKVEFKNMQEWKGLVEKKKELAGRLLAQYVYDYELSKGQSGDIKMVLATQRSGTVTDKVYAFSILVGGNPITNIKSIDALLGMETSKVGKRYAFTGFEALK